MNTLICVSYITVLYGMCKCQSSCPAGSVYNSALEMCYWPSANLMTYHEHVSACALDGGVLLTIPDEVVYDYVYSNIPLTHWFSSHYDIYLGMYDVFNSGTFYHVEERPNKQAFLPWSNGAQPAPLGYTPDQDCGIIDSSNKFQDKTCTEKHRAVCSNAASTSLECPTNNFLFYNKTCFWSKTTTRKAEKQLQSCLDDGGTLAVIRNQETLNKVTDKFNDWFGSNVNAYVGYNDYEEETTFRESYYVELLTWSKWGTGEPTSGANERCVEMWYLNGEWNDLYCTDTKQAVCQKHVAPDVVTTMITTEQQESTLNSATTSTAQISLTTETEPTSASSTTKTVLSTQTIQHFMTTTSDSVTTDDTASGQSTETTLPVSTHYHNAVSNATFLHNQKDICAAAARDCPLNFTWSHHKVKNRIAYLRSRLKIQRNSTKVHRRSKYSPYEADVITYGIGMVGVIVILSVVAVFVILDLTYKLKPT